MLAKVMRWGSECLFERESQTACHFHRSMESKSGWRLQILSMIRKAKKHTYGGEIRPLYSTQTTFLIYRKIDTHPPSCVKFTRF